MRLVRYWYARCIVCEDEIRFQVRFEGWVICTVLPALYRCHRGQFKDSERPKGDPDTLTPKQRQTVDAVLSYYGDKSSQWLSDLTHREAPWIQARKGLEPGDPGKREISHASMAEYYSNPY